MTTVGIRRDDDPVDHLENHVEDAGAANERGERAAERLFTLLPALGRRGVFARRPRVLDVGCAYGGFLVAFARRGARVRDYLGEIAWTPRRTDEEIRRFLLLYGAPFWTVLARRR